MTGIFPPRSRSLLAGSHPVNQQQFVGGHEYSHAPDTPPVVSSKSATGPRSRLPKQLHSIREHPGLESFPSNTQERHYQATNSSLTNYPLPQVPVSSSAGNVHTEARPAYDTPNGASIAAVAAIQQRSGPSNIGHEANAAATYSGFSPHASESEGESTVPSSTKRRNPGLDQIPSQPKFRPSNIVQSHGQNGSHVHRTSSRASTTIAGGASLNSKIYPVVTGGSISTSITSNNNSNNSSDNTATTTDGRNRRLRSEDEVSDSAPGSNPLKSKMTASPHFASSSTTPSPAKKAAQQLHLTDIPFATRSFANDPCVGTSLSKSTPSPTKFSIAAKFSMLTSPSRAL